MSESNFQNETEAELLEKMNQIQAELERRKNEKVGVVFDYVIEQLSDQEMLKRLHKHLSEFLGNNVDFSSLTREQQQAHKMRLVKEGLMGHLANIA